MYKTKCLAILLFVTLIFSYPVSAKEHVNKYEIKKLLFSDLLQAISMAEEMYNEAIQNNNKANEADALYYMGIGMVNIGEIDSACALQKLSLSINEELSNKTGMANNLFEIGSIYYNNGEYDIALKYFLQSLSNSKDEGYKSGEAAALNFIGKYHHTKGKFERSFEFYNQALSLAKQAKDSIRIAYLYNNIGNHYETIGNYVEALKYSLESVKIAEALNNKIILGTAYNHLGGLYLILGDYEIALKYHQMALKARQDLGYIEGIGKSYKNIGSVYISIGEYKKALTNYEKSLTYCREVGYKKGITKSLLGIGKVLSISGKFDEAKVKLEESLEVSNEMGYDKGIMNAKYELGLMYTSLGKYTMATKMLRESLTIAKESEMKEMVSDAYFNLYKIEKTKSNYEEALNYYVLFEKEKNLLLDEEKSRQLALLQTRFETEKKEKENELLRQKNNFQVFQLKQKNRIILLTASTILLLFILLFSYYGRLKAKNKDNKLLKELNRKVTAQNKQLEKLNKKLNTANAEKDKFFSIIAHELRNPLWWFRNITDLLSKNYDSMSREKIKNAIKSLDESAKNSFHLIDNLLQWSRSQLDRVKFNPLKLDLKQVAVENIDFVKSIANYRKIELISQIEENTFIKADKDLLNTVFRNLISNSLKYTSENGEIIISCLVDEEFAEISVKDSGIGISPKDLKKLFREDLQFTTLGISQEKGSGIGLILCKEFVEKNGGEIWVESKEGEGTNFKFTIPVFEKVLVEI